MILLSVILRSKATKDLSDEGPFASLRMTQRALRITRLKDFRKEKQKMKEKKLKADTKKKIKTEELTDEKLNEAAGGVQAGLITTGGSGEFGPHHPDSEEQKQTKPTWF